MIIRLPPLKTLRAFEKDSIRKRARTKRVSIEFPFVITEKQYCYNYWQNDPHQRPISAGSDCMRLLAVLMLHGVISDINTSYLIAQQLS